MAAVELFDFRDLSELTHAAELRGSEALNQGVPRVALMMSSLIRRNVRAALTRFELVERREVVTDGCDLYDITVALPTTPSAAATRRPLGCAIIPRAAVTGLAELFMGGPGEPDDRFPNRFERSLLARRLSDALVPLWQALDVGGAEPPGLTYIETPLAHVPLSSVVVGIALTLGERTWELNLALASSVIDADLDPAPRGEAMTMARAVRDVPIEVTVSFGPITVRASDVEAFAVGDVVRLDQPTDVPLVAQSQGRPLLLVRHGTTGRRVAVEVVELLDVAELAGLAADEAAHLHDRRGHVPHTAG